MHRSLAETAPETVEHDTKDEAVRTVRYPSMDFPVRPAIEFTIPESWRPIGPSVVDEMRSRPDVAVAGPDVVGGVRPNLMAKVSRVPVDGVTAPTGPSDLLRTLFSRQRGDETPVDFECRIHDEESDARPYGVSRYIEHLGDVDVLRLTCAVIVTTGPVVHLVIVQGALGPTDGIGRAAIEAAFASLRVTAPSPTATGPETIGA